MKHAVIVEDEVIAASNLRRQLAAVAPQLQVDAVLQSIEDTVDYLLKPISADALRRALDKLQRLTAAGAPANPTLQQLVEMMQQQGRRYKRYFLISEGERLVPFPVDQIAYVYLDGSTAYLYDFDGHSRPYNKPLDAIAAELDPQHFFRVNRQYIVAHRAVKELALWPIGKLKIHLHQPTPEPIFVSRAKVSEFKDWYTK